MDQFERTRLLLGEETLTLLQNQKIAIIGIGGVGSYAAEALARLGILEMTLVDYDTIDITNLNRQLMTSYENIGQKKVTVFEKRIQSYARDTKVHLIEDKLTEDNIRDVIPQDLDYIIDACDTVSVKKELIRFAKRAKIKLISVMGTGNKLDPSKLEIVDVMKTSYDPLAKIIRKMVKEEKLKGKVMVISSSEKPKPFHHPVASISFVPGAAGLLAASYIVNDVIKNANRK